MDKELAKHVEKTIYSLDELLTGERSLGEEVRNTGNRIKDYLGSEEFLGTCLYYYINMRRRDK